MGKGWITKFKMASNQKSKYKKMSEVTLSF